jgi:LPS-assembly protein
VEFKRHEVRTSYITPDFSLSGAYAFIKADGVEFEDREQVSGYARASLSDYWSVNARSSYNLVQSELLSIGGGLRYLDECFDMSLDVRYTPRGDTEETEGNFNALFSITFRNLGGLDVPY